MLQVTSRQFPVIAVEGAPYARGLSYGRQARDMIGLTLQTYLSAWGAADKQVKQQLLDRVAPLRFRIEQHFPHLIEEIAGIAQGSGFAIDEIVALNARTELMFGAKSSEDGCTGMAVLPAAADGKTLIGQNWDWLPDAASLAIVLKIKSSSGPDIVTFVEAGMLARSGMNSDGLGLCGNYVQTDADFKQSGVPIPVVRRAILEQSSLPDAIGVVERVPRAFSSNHLLAHRSGHAVDLEATPQQVYVIEPQDGILVHANHFQTQESGFADVGVARFPDSPARERRVRQLLNGYGSVGRDDMIGVLKDQDGFPHSICRFTSKVQGQGAVETVASVVMDLTDSVMWLARGPDIRDYDEIRLDAKV